MNNSDKSINVMNNSNSDNSIDIEDNSIYNRLDDIESTVMDELKDFQQYTVNRIDYLFKKGQKRILVSDEVGLGKTLIARGTIAKFAKLRKEEGDDLVKVVYICSNASIAQQNLDKLRIVNELKAEESDTSRLSMQHLNIFNQENDEDVLNRYIQLIPLTPLTSFKITNSQGTRNERALIYVILKKLSIFRYCQNGLSEFLRYGVEGWDGIVTLFESKVKKCNEKSNGEYLEYMIEELTKRLVDIQYDNKSLSTVLKNHSKKAVLDKSPEFRRKSRELIILLRTIFSDISLNKLEPDLIIMDEFQRFKYLLNSDEESEMGKLTSKFFNSKSVRILMLSATPYKMYSTLDEIDETQVDEHYKEFFDVINFLNICKKDKEKFNDIWNNYSIELKEFNKNNDSFILAKNTAEAAMYKNICRTERITESQVGDIIDDSDKKISLEVFKEDVQSYIQVQKLLDEIGLNNSVPLDYIKSTPYLMSFMKNYQLKRSIERYFRRNPLKISAMNKSTFFLKRSDINNYRKIPYNHARLNVLMKKVLENNGELLLWIPPSKEYYPSEGVFKDVDNFSKTLIFSSWEMVPRMISSLVSYEVERKTIGKLAKNNPKIKYFLKNRYPSPRITFSLKEGVTSQMNLVSLIYPSKFLADVYNPIEHMNNKFSLERIEEIIKSKIKEKLDKFDEEYSIREDQRWYYLAPVLLDLEYDDNYTINWFFKFKQFLNNAPKGFKAHIDKFKEQIGTLRNGEKLGRKPDDLLDVLCDLAIASPANCIYRSYQKELTYDDSIENYTHLATQISRAFLSNLNTPESIAVIDLSCGKAEEAYWRNILTYSKQGNLQAVFDEYVHLLSNGLDKNNEKRIRIIHHKFLESMEIRTTAYDVDTFNSFKNRMLKNDKTYNNLRTHYAVSFTKGKSDGRDVNRKKTVRDAFNSPFRPFVLASTSIGQEGLDFHNYCRRIVHWNLPSNPIDLEQREGRINRFECLAIRQNIAKRYGHISFEKDIWIEMFNKANEIEKLKSRRTDNEGNIITCSDLIPYWGLSHSEDMVKIERIVPMYPFSKDEERYDRLIKILSLYRLTLGQARQEELIDTNLIDLDFEDVKDSFINLSPFYKRNQELDEEFCTAKEIKESLEDLTSNLNSNLTFNSNSNSKFVENKELISEYNLISNLKEANKYLDKGDLHPKKRYIYWRNMKKILDKEGIFKETWINYYSPWFLIPIEAIRPDLAHLEMLVWNGFIEVKLFVSNDRYADRGLYRYLRNNKDLFENKLGFRLNWNDTGGFVHISVYTPMNINDVSIWDKAQNWHINMIKRFKEVFYDEIRNYYKNHPYIADNELRTQYWLKLEECINFDTIKPLNPPNKHSRYVFTFDGIGFNLACISLYVPFNKHQITTAIRIPPESNKELFDYLKWDKKNIEKELGFELDWISKNHHDIQVTYRINIKDKNNWNEALEWHSEMVDKFKKVFQSRIKDFYE